MGEDVAKPLVAADLEASLTVLGVPECERLAVAVSGGPDSLCLALLAAESRDVVCLIVDHGLRKESSEEATRTVELLVSHGVRAERLEWKAVKPAANVQAEAREARYELMGDWCQQNGVRYLLTAHHQDDQAETLLLRLARGSGVYGLAAMAPARQILVNGEAITLIRPLLAFPKARLKQTLVDRGVAWVEDPSNKAEQYDRVKVRKFLANPPLEGFRTERLAATAARLRRTRNALEFYEKEWLKACVTSLDDGSLLFDAGAMESAPEEIVLRGLSSMLRYVSGAHYVPRAEKLQRLVKAILSHGFEGYTLYGVQIAPSGESGLVFFRELRAAEGRISAADGNCWDNRFEISARSDIAGLEIGPLGQKGWEQVIQKWPEVRDIALPHVAKLAWPVVYDGENIIAIPHLKVAEADDIGVSLSLKSHGWPKK